MSLADLLGRAPFRVRHGTQAIVEDRHGVSAFVIAEPVHFPAERVEDAQAWCDLINDIAETCGPGDHPALPQAAE